WWGLLAPLSSSPVLPGGLVSYVSHPSPGSGRSGVGEAEPVVCGGGDQGDVTASGADRAGDGPQRVVLGAVEVVGDAVVVQQLDELAGDVGELLTELREAGQVRHGRGGGGE